MSNNKNMIAIHFSAYSQTNYGQTVCITGNCPELGMWDPKKGLKLQTNPRQYPIWFSKKPFTIQKLINLQYKICIIDKDGVALRWENLRQNRNLYLKTSCSIFFTEGQPEVEYDFQNSDSASTQINSTKKTTLSDIQQEQDDDQPNTIKQSLKYYQKNDDRKRSGSSIGRSSSNNRESHLFQNQLIKSQSDIGY